MKKMLILVSGVLFASCAELGLGTSKRNSWIYIHNEITAKFRYPHHVYSKEAIAQMNDKLSNVYKNGVCYGIEEKQIDEKVCKKTGLIISNVNEFYAEWNSLSIYNEKLDEIGERTSEHLSAKNLKDRKKRMLEKKVQLAKFMDRYGLNLFKNKDNDTMSSMAFYVENRLLKDSIDLEISKIDKFLAEISIRDKNDEERMKHCRPYDEKVSAMSGKLAKLEAQIRTAQTDAIASEKMKEFQDLGEKYRYLVFDRNYKNCTTYQGQGD